MLPEHDVHVVAVKRSDACHTSLRCKSAVDEGNGMKHGQQGMHHHPAVPVEARREVSVAGDGRSLLHHNRLNDVVALPRKELLILRREKLSEMSRSKVLPFSGWSLPFLEPHHRIKGLGKGRFIYVIIITLTGTSTQQA